MLETYERFMKFELRHELFERMVCDVPFWSYIRSSVYLFAVLPQLERLGAAHPDFAATRNSQAQAPAESNDSSSTRLAHFLQRIRVDPAFAIRRRRVLLALAPRLVKTEQGTHVRIWIDFFVHRLKSQFAALEYPYPALEYATHAGCGRIFHPDGALRAVAEYKASPEFLSRANLLERRAQWLAEKLSREFAIKVNWRWLQQRIASAVAQDVAAVPVLSGYLRRLGVRCVVEAVAYSERNRALTKAAHDLGIPVVELQHGTIYSAHPGYNLPVADPQYSPDYLLTWGDYWASGTRNYPAKRTVAVGYPYLAHSLKSFPRKASANGVVRILFISQGTVGAELADVARELSERLPADQFTVSFKLHPNESRTWRSQYPSLAGSGVKVIENDARSVYECFGESDAIVGVYSTALIEGLMWGLRTYVLASLPGGDTMRPFAEAGAVDIVNSSDELAMRLGEIRTQPSKCAVGAEKLFMGGDAAARVASFIDNVAGVRSGNDALL